MKIICYGDSNTYGYDPRSFLGEQYAAPWPEILAEISGWEVENQGENGREIPQITGFFPDDTDLLIIMLGTNDLLQFWSPEAATEKMRRFLEALPLKRESILLIAPPTMVLGQWVQDQELIDDSVALAHCYRRLAEELAVPFLSAGEWHIPMAYDGVHMTEKGHRIFAEKLLGFLSSVHNKKFRFSLDATGG